MTGVELAIVIEGSREDWPRGPRTLTPHDPIREPNGRTLWFGAGLDPDGEQVWFRIDEEAIGRMPEKTPAARGQRLVDALIVWITPDRQLEPGINRFEVRVSEAGDTVPGGGPCRRRRAGDRPLGAGGAGVGADEPGRVDDRRDARRELDDEPDGGCTTRPGRPPERGAVARYL